MGLFSKPNIPSIDTNALNNIATNTANKKRAIVNGLTGDLAPISANYETKRNSLGTNYINDVNGNVATYQNDLQGLKTANTTAADDASNAYREQAFRDVPEVQRAIRESLGGSGTLNTGAARANLAKPILSAAQSSADFNTNATLDALSKNSAIDEKGVDYGANSRASALESKFGLDKDTVDYLTSIGRSDLIDKANANLGIEGDLGNDQLAIEQAKQASDIARATAGASQRGAVIGGLSQLAGGGIGLLASGGNPMGFALGSQIGGTVGNVATGSPTTVDPTLLFALAQKNKNAVVNGTRVPVRPY